MQETISNIEEYLSFQKEVFGEDILILEDVSNSIANQLDDSVEKVLTVNESNKTISPAIEVIDKAEITQKPDEQAIVAEPVTETPAISTEVVIEKPSQVTTPNTLENIEDWRAATSLDTFAHCIKNCKNCKLSEYRNNVVFGTGNPNADIMVIGEGPGAEEDMTGYPFVGRAGQLLTKILAAIDFSREEVFIANIVKCRPPKNRRPEADEVAACEPYLHKQIELIAPKFILALGLTAIDTLFKQKFKMGETRGKLMQYQGITTLATYHPAALLRNPNLKRDTWEDVKLLKKLYLESKEKEL